MSNEFFNATGTPGTRANGSSAAIRAEILAIAQGFDKLPGLTANPDKIVTVNAAGTAQSARSLVGTTNQVTVTITPASITLSLPQDLHSGASPTFAGLTINGDVAISGNVVLGDADTDTLAVRPSAVTWTNNPTHSGNHTFSGNVTIASAAQASSIKTASGAALIATSAPTTMFTANAPGLYLVFADIGGTADPASYEAFSYVLTDSTGTDTRIVTGSAGGLLTISKSGQAIQMTQLSGGPATVQWRYLRIAS